MLKLTLLGYPTITFCDSPLTTFISNKTLILLCYLASHPRSYARETLAGLFWGGVSNERALSNLRQSLHNLQKLAPDYLIVTRQSVAFDHTRLYWMDTQALYTSDALEHYQGDFMDGIMIEEAPEIDHWLQVERERHRLQYIHLLEQQLLTHTRRADWVQVQQIAQKLIGVDPWREAAYCDLMLAMARTGAYNSALLQFEQLQQRLKDELGVEPTQETRAVYTRIQQAREIKRHNLPVMTHPFVGRDTELQQLSEWVSDPDCHLITLSGIGGVGKSRLAHEIAAAHVNHFLHGVRYVHLAPVTDAEFVIYAIAQAIGLTFQGTTEPCSQLLAHLADHEMLLVLDNFERVMDAAPLISDLIMGAPALKVIVTSRHRLELQEEWVFSIEGLPYPDEKASIGEIETYSSVQYFAQRAPRNLTSPTDLQAAADLCRLLEGLPLGIELAAVSANYDTLIEHVHSLQAVWRNAQERHRSLRAVFDYSWRLLTPHEQKILASLSVFQGSFTSEAACQIMSASESTLQRLVRQSLLRFEYGRYSLHTVIQHYGLEMLRKSASEEMQIIRAHTIYYVSHLHDVDEVLRQHLTSEAVALLEPELDNVHAAWRNAIAYGDRASLEQMSEGLHRYYDVQNAFQEGNELFDFATQHYTPTDRVRGRLLAHSAGFKLRLGQVEQAAEASECSITLLNELQDEHLAFALNVFGVAQLYKGAFVEAETALAACADIYRRLNSAQRLKPLINLGSMYFRSGDYEQAGKMLEEGRIIAEEINDHRGVCHILVNLGAVYYNLNDWDTAEHHYLEALARSSSVNYLHIKLVTLINLGELQFHQGRLSNAIESCKAGVELAYQIEDQRNLVHGLHWLGLSHLATGKRNDARKFLWQGMEVALHSNALPIILLAATGVAAYLIPHEQAARILQTVIDHPTTERDCRDFAQAQLEALALDSVISYDIDELKCQVLPQILGINKRM